jgi:hypothetical protein
MRYETLVKELVNSFPELDESVKKELEDPVYHNEILPHILFGHVFRHFIVKELSSMKDKKLLERIFKFLETMAISEDKEVKGVLTASILEYLGDDKNILDRARLLMGNETIRLSHEVEKSWGREG